MVLPEIVTIFLLAFAVSMDAFSFAIGIGEERMSLNKRLVFIGAIGGLHLFMPLAGMMIGNYLSTMFEMLVHYISGGVLIVIGVQMCMNQLKENKQLKSYRSNTTLFILAFLISLDSFSVSTSIGMFHIHILPTLVIFGMTTILLTSLGLWVGGKMKTALGKYGELFGGAILIFLGLRIFFN